MTYQPIDPMWLPWLKGEVESPPAVFWQVGIAKQTGLECNWDERQINQVLGFRAYLTEVGQAISYDDPLVADLRRVGIKP